MSSTIQNVRRNSRRAILESQLSAYRATPRKFPWRKTRDPYKILVSEIMLQQTQAERVVPYFVRFVRAYPTVLSLRNAKLADIIRVWQGLGYNRRAKYLRDAALLIGDSEAFPKEYEALRALPGVGDYTAKAIRVFAFNIPEEMIETNIRAVYIHTFLNRSRNVRDAEILKLIKETLDTKEPRLFYSALMDYGSELKRRGVNPSRTSSTHKRQKPFKGSRREVRGALVRRLANNAETLKMLSLLPFPKNAIKEELAKLSAEGLVKMFNGKWRIAD